MILFFYYKWMVSLMNNETLQSILKIDDKAKDNVKLIEEKNKEVEKYIKQEIAVKEAALEASYKEKIIKLEQEYENKFKETKENLELETKNKIENNKKIFESNKYQKIDEIVANIIKI